MYGNNDLDGIAILCNEIGNVNILLYNDPCVCVADVHQLHHGLDPAHQAHQATELPVVLYEVATAVPFVPFVQATQNQPPPPFEPHKHGQHVQVANAAHPVFHDAALPFRAIFAVHVSVSVPST